MYHNKPNHDSPTPIEEDYDLSGTPEEYWKRAKQRISERRQVPMQDTEAGWQELKTMDWLEKYIDACQGGI